MKSTFSNNDTVFGKCKWSAGQPRLCVQVLLIYITHLLIWRNFIALTFHYIVRLENSGFTTYL